MVVDVGELEKGWLKIRHTLDIGFGEIDLKLPPRGLAFCSI